MLARTVLGLGIFGVLVTLGLTVERLRRTRQPMVRAAAGQLHRGIGALVLAIALVFALTALRLLLG